MSREWQLYKDDMRAAAAKVVRFTFGMDRRDFADNELVRDAVLRNLEIIGEAAKHIPPAAAPGLPMWTGVALSASATSSPTPILASTMQYCGTLSR